MSVWKLRLSMLTTLALIIGISTSFFAVILGYLGSFNIISLITLVALSNVAQWLLAPYLIKALYRVKPAQPHEYGELHSTLDLLSRRSGIKKPKLGIASMPIPNAFAYGSPLTGNHVVVTSTLLDTLEDGEVEAVLGHEIGHLKHRDVQVMMLVSFLPSLVYLLGRSMIYSSYLGNNRNGRGGGSMAGLIGAASMALYFVLTLFTLRLSRLREYYADRHGASIVEGGPRKLSEGLAKIVSANHNGSRGRGRQVQGSFKALFISDPSESGIAKGPRRSVLSYNQGLVEHYLHREITRAERIKEVFSTHPNITKRLTALSSLEHSREMMR
jgi:heat shock protein HtpX